MITLTHVCRRWRDAILSYPLIWSHIYVGNGSPEPLVATELERSRGVPLTVNILYSSSHILPSGCGCTHDYAWEDGDDCSNISGREPPLEVLDPFIARIHTLNVRYLRNGKSYGNPYSSGFVSAPFFFESFPNLESLRWSCRDFGEISTFSLPRKLFGSSLPRLQKLSMVDCWGLGVTDTPALKAMSLECTGEADRAKIYSQHLVNWLRRRQSLVSLSFTGCHIVPDAKGTPNPVSMKKLKEIVLRNVDVGVVSRYVRCPSMGTITTLRIAPLTQVTWADSSTVSLTATDGLGGSISTVVHLTSDALLATTWEAFALAFQHSVTTLEVEDLDLISRGVTAIPKLIGVLPDSHTIRIQLPRVLEGFRILREILSHGHGITRVERLVCKAEGLDEARRKDEEWKTLCAEYKIHDSLA